MICHHPDVLGLNGLIYVVALSMGVDVCFAPGGGSVG